MLASPFAQPDNAEAKSGLDNVVATINMQSSSGEVDQERQARAMADPEIQAILGDAQYAPTNLNLGSPPRRFSCSSLRDSCKATLSARAPCTRPLHHAVASGCVRS